MYGKGTNIRNWIHVDDHNDGVDLILHKGKIGETYCLGGLSEKTNIEITKIILDEFGYNTDMIEYVKDRKGHDFRYAIDFTKINKDLGWTPKINLREGIKNTIKWYKDNENWWKPLKKITIYNITEKQ